MPIVIYPQLPDLPPLPDHNAHQGQGCHRPCDHEQPDIDFLVGPAKPRRDFVQATDSPVKPSINPLYSTVCHYSVVSLRRCFLNMTMVIARNIRPIIPDDIAKIRAKSMTGRDLNVSSIQRPTAVASPLEPAVYSPLATAFSQSAVTAAVDVSVL
jgi:hypothetical protein